METAGRPRWVGCHGPRRTSTSAPCAKRRQDDPPPASKRHRQKQPGRRCGRRDRRHVSPTTSVPLPAPAPPAQRRHRREVWGGRHASARRAPRLGARPPAPRRRAPRFRAPNPATRRSSLTQAPLGDASPFLQQELPAAAARRVGAASRAGVAPRRHPRLPRRESCVPAEAQELSVHVKTAMWKGRKERVSQTTSSTASACVPAREGPSAASADDDGAGLRRDRRAPGGTHGSDSSCVKAFRGGEEGRAR